MDPADYNPFGNFSVMKIGNETAGIRAPGIYAVINKGKLVYVFNRITDEATLSYARIPGQIPSSGNQQGLGLGVGLEWELAYGDEVEARVDLDAGVSEVSLNSMSLNSLPGNHYSIVFAFDYDSDPLFDVTYDLDFGTGEVAITMDYDTSQVSLPSFGGNPSLVSRAWLMDCGVAPDVDHLRCADGGVILEWETMDDLSANSNTARVSYGYPNALTIPTTILTDKSGGSLVIDLGPLITTADFVTHHWREPNRFTGFGLVATPFRTAQQAGSLGPITFQCVNEPWDEIMESYQPGITNPHKPSWFDDIEGYFNVSQLTANSKTDETFFLNLVPDVFGGSASVPTALDTPFLMFFRRAFQTFAMGGAGGIPDINFDDNLKDIAGAVKAENWRISLWQTAIEYNPNSTEINCADPLLIGQDFLDHRIGLFDKGTGTVLSQFTDFNEDGMFTPLNDRWWIGMGWPSWRDLVLCIYAQVEEDVETYLGSPFEFDAINFDFAKSQMRLADRNALNTQIATTGFANLASEARTLLEDPIDSPDEISIEVEGIDSYLVSQGQSFGRAHITSLGEFETDVIGIRRRRRVLQAHPMGMFALTPEVKGFTSFVNGEPAKDQLTYWLTKIPQYVQGTLPTGAASFSPNNEHLNTHPSVYRALLQNIEEAAWRVTQNVTTHASAHADWSDPTTVHIFDTNSGTIVWDEDFMVRKFICDLFWQFAGRAPGNGELNFIAAKYTFNPGSIAAMVTEIREFFDQTPTPPANIQTRPQFRASVIQVLPGYPVP